MGLRTYIIKRIIYSIFLLLFVLSLNFIIFMLMPANPTSLFAATGKLTEDQVKEIEAMYGFDQPIHVQYIKYIYNMLTFQLGYSFYSKNPVAKDILIRLPNTFLLVGSSTILSIILGVVLGVLAAYKRGSMYDDFLVIISLITFSLPTFWMGMIAILIFHFYLGWLPGSHSFPPEWMFNPPTNILQIIQGYFAHLILPLTVLTAFMYGGYLLLTRACMLETLTEDYIVTARAKGVSERKVLFKHALKNASLPLITNVVLSFAFMITGAMITEQVFTYPGMGQWIYQAINYGDYPVLQATFYIIALIVIIANFIADLLYGIVDPRIKYG
jgi:peptide/nickel transport system permease protein